MLRLGVTVQNAIFPALLVVNDELHGQLGAPGPLGVRRVPSVALEVPRVRQRVNRRWGRRGRHGGCLCVVVGVGGWVYVYVWVCDPLFFEVYGERSGGGVRLG